MRRYIAFGCVDDVKECANVGCRNGIGYLNYQRWANCVETPLNYFLFVSSLFRHPWQTLNSRVGTSRLRTDDHKAAKRVAKRRDLLQCFVLIRNLRLEFQANVLDGAVLQ